MATVKVKFGDRLLRLRPQSMTTRNLAMIFKLDVNQGIYLNCEEEGEIILPSAENGGLFEIENFDKIYVVNGDVPSTQPCASPALSPLTINPGSVPIGVPLSYQPATQRSAINPPPCDVVANSAQRSQLQRPRFTSSASVTKKSNGWKKSVTVIDVDRIGNITEKYQIHLQLCENTASVNSIQGLLRGQLGFDVTLLDAKYLPVMPSDTTKGSQFWRSNRKILVANTVQAENIKRTRSSSKKKKPHEILEHLKRLVAETPDDEYDDPASLSLSLMSPNPSHSSVSSAASSNSNEEATKIVSNIFKCSICLNKAELPAAACSCCYSVIGCIPCLEQWYESSANNQAKCPLCRTTKEYNTIPLLREIASLLQQPVPEFTSQSSAHSDTESLDTIPYGDSEVVRGEESEDEFPVVLE